MQTPDFLSLTDILIIHEDQIASFGGTPGIRDQGLLESALAQPEATFAGELLHPTIDEQALVLRVVQRQITKKELGVCLEQIIVLEKN